MGSAQSRVRPPVLYSGDNVPAFPPTAGPFWSSAPDAEKPVYYAKQGIASEAHFKAITLPELLARAAKKHADHPALCVERPVQDFGALPVVDGKPQVPPPMPLEQWTTWTYAQYLRDVRAMAKAYMAIGFAMHDAVNVYGFNSPEWVIAQMASNFAGGRSAGIYPTDTAEQIQFKCDHSNGSVIAVDTQKNLNRVKQIIDQLPYMKAVICWGKLEKPGEKWKNGEGKEIPVLEWNEFMKLGEKITDAQLDARINSIRPGHCCALVYTSGTTGNPKAVMLSHDNVIFESFVVTTEGVDDLGNREQERYLSYLPLSHIAGMMVDVISPLNCTVWLNAYATAYFARPYDMKVGTLVDRMGRVKPTMFLGVPRVWEKMADKLKSVVSELTGVKSTLTKWAMAQGLEYTTGCNYGGDGSMSMSYMLADKLVLSKVRAKLGLDECHFAFSGAAPLQLETQEYLGSFGLNINQGYGMSEGSGASSWSTNASHMWGCAGFPLFGSELRVYQGDPTDVNDKKEAPRAKDIFHATEEEQGEICARGRHVMMGYMANPRLGQEHVDDIDKKNRETIDKDGFLHSADKGALSEAGFVIITGRYKELIIGAGGENIAPVPIEDQIKKICPIISNVIMIGDKRKFNIALVTLKLQGATGELPGTNKLSPEVNKNLGTNLSTIEEAMSDPKVISEITERIKETNKNGKVVISNACTIQKFMILPRDVSIDTGDLTATLKLKRGYVTEKFAKVIDKIYGAKDTYVKFPMDMFNQFYKGY